MSTQQKTFFFNLPKPDMTKVCPAGFSLIELLVVCSIIALMTVLAVPFFSRYGTRSEYNLRTIEIKNLIDQMNNMAKNPEQGVTRYVIKTITSEPRRFELYKTSDNSANNLIKTISLPSGYGLSLSDAGRPYLVCDTPASFCCQTSTSTSTCKSLGMNNEDYVSISVSEGDGYGAFKIFSNPFRVEYHDL